MLRARRPCRTAGAGPGQGRRGRWSRLVARCLARSHPVIGVSGGSWIGVPCQQHGRSPDLPRILTRSSCSKGPAAVQVGTRHALRTQADLVALLVTALRSGGRDAYSQWRRSAPAAACRGAVPRRRGAYRLRVTRRCLLLHALPRVPRVPRVSRVPRAPRAHSVADARDNAGESAVLSAQTGSVLALGVLLHPPPIPV